MNLFDALATSVAAADYPAILASTTPERPVAADVPLLKVSVAEKPVLQFSFLPITLDAALYRNALSDSNPKGDMKPLFAFRQLADPIPSFSQYYTPSTGSTEQIYGGIVQSAAGENDFTLRAIDGARKQFDLTTFARMDGSVGDNWRPVYAIPEDWHDTSQDSRFRDLDIDLTGDGGPDSPFATIGAQRALGLLVGGEPGGGTPLDPGTTIRSVHMKYMFVQFRRPWLNPLIFETGGWYLSSQPEGYCSSGSLDDNHGALPLLTTGMLVAKEISVDAEWSERDRARLADARSSGMPISLGPLSLTASAGSSTLQVIGWISSLVPYSPRSTDLRPGSIVVTNKGAFVARFSMTWQEGATVVNRESGSMLALAATDISIPADARNISIKVEIMTAPWPMETWRTIATYQSQLPVKRCYEVSGTTITPAIKEIACPQ